MENRYFNEALASMTAGLAYVDAVKHMYNEGYSVAEIQKNLTYSVSVEKIEKVIAECEEAMKKQGSDYEYVQTVNEYGRKSFVRVKKEKA